MQWASMVPPHCLNIRLSIEDRRGLIRVPIIKSTACADLAIVTDSKKRIYKEIDEEMKEEAQSRRDHW